MPRRIKKNSKSKRKKRHDSKGDSDNSNTSKSQSEGESSNSTSSSSSEEDTSNDSSTSEKKDRRKYHRSRSNSSTHSNESSPKHRNSRERWSKSSSSNRDSDSEESHKWTSRSRSGSPIKNEVKESAQCTKVRKKISSIPPETGEVKMKYVKGWGFVKVKNKARKRKPQEIVDEFGRPKLDTSTIKEMVRKTEALRSTLVKKKNPKSQSSQTKKPVISLSRSIDVEKLSGIDNEKENNTVNGKERGDGSATKDEDNSNPEKENEVINKLEALPHEVDKDGFKMPINPKVIKSGFVVVDRIPVQLSQQSSDKKQSNNTQIIDQKSTDAPDKGKLEGKPVPEVKPKKEKNYRRKTNDEQFLKQKQEEYAEMMKRQAEKAHKMNELQEVLMTRIKNHQEKISEDAAKIEKKHLQSEVPDQFPLLHLPSMQEALLYGIHLTSMQPQPPSYSFPVESAYGISQLGADANANSKSASEMTKAVNEASSTGTVATSPNRTNASVNTAVTTSTGTASTFSNTSTVLPNTTANLNAGPPPNRPPPLLTKIASGPMRDERIEGEEEKKSNLAMISTDKHLTSWESKPTTACLTNPKPTSSGISHSIDLTQPGQVILPRDLPPPSVVLNGNGFKAEQSSVRSTITQPSNIEKAQVVFVENNASSLKPSAISKPTLGVEEGKLLLQPPLGQNTSHQQITASQLPPVTQNHLRNEPMLQSSLHFNSSLPPGDKRSPAFRNPIKPPLQQRPPLIHQNMVRPILFNGCYPPPNPLPPILQYRQQAQTGFIQPQPRFIQPSLQMWPWTGPSPMMSPSQLAMKFSSGTINSPQRHLSDATTRQSPVKNMRTFNQVTKDEQPTTQAEGKVKSPLQKRHKRKKKRSRKSMDSQEEGSDSSSGEWIQRDSRAPLPTPPPLTKLGLWMPPPVGILSNSAQRPSNIRGRVNTQRPSNRNNTYRSNRKRSISPKKRRLHSPDSSASPPPLLHRRSSSSKAKTVSSAALSTSEYGDFSGGEELEAVGEISA